MPISPELFLIPNVAKKFTQAGLTHEILSDFILGKTNRNLISDARRLLFKYEEEIMIETKGIQNIPDGGIIAFNHPDNDVMIPAFLKMVVVMADQVGKELSLVMASEVMIASNLNDKVALPGSIKFIERFHSLYHGSLISAPTVITRKDFVLGRAIAARKALEKLKNGQIVGIAPEGHTELGNKISPIETFHSGSGALARLAKRFNKPTIPVAIWKEQNCINISMGEPFYVQSENDNKSVIEIMSRIASRLPERFRGPFE